MRRAPYQWLAAAIGAYAVMRLGALVFGGLHAYADLVHLPVLLLVIILFHAGQRRGGRLWVLTLVGLILHAAAVFLLVTADILIDHRAYDVPPALMFLDDAWTLENLNIKDRRLTFELAWLLLLGCVLAAETLTMVRPLPPPVATS